MLCSRSHSTFKESGEEKITSGQETASAMPVHLQQCCVRSIKRNQDQGGRGDALGGSGAADGKTGGQLRCVGRRRYQWQQARRSYHKTAKARPQEGEAEGRDQQKFQGEENSAEDFQAEQSIEGHMVTEPPGPLAWGRNSSEARADWWSSSST